MRRFLAKLAGGLAGPDGPEPVRQLEAERARLSDERFRQLADHIADAFWIRSVDMRTLHYISPAFERIWGRSVASLYADPQAWSSFIVPEDRERVLAAFRAIGESPPLDIEYRIARPDGEVRWVRVRGFQVRDAAGVVIRHTGIVTDITDRRQVEAALQESEQRYRALVEWSPEPVAVTRAGTILFLNPAAVTMIGAASSRQLLGKPIFDLVHPDYQAVARARVEQATSRGGGLPMHEEKFIRLDGTVIEVEVQGTSIVYDGEPALFSSMRDVTASNRAVAALRASEAESRTLNRALMMLGSSAGASAGTGSAFFEQLAANMADALGAEAGFVLELRDGDPPIARAIAAVVEGTVTAGFDCAISGTFCEQLLSSDTSTIASLLPERRPAALALLAPQARGYLGRRLTGAAGQPTGLLFVLFRDLPEDTKFVTATLEIFAARAASELERQRMDARVREQAALLDIAHEAIMVESLDGRIVYWNKGAERTFGWGAAEAMGRTSVDLFYDDPEQFRAALAALHANGEWQGEVLKRTKDGRVIPVDARWTLVRDVRDEAHAILKINTDISERKALESRFLRAQRLESIGTLAGGIAHDLNNMLTPILMSVDMLQQTVTDEQAQGLLATMRHSAQRGADLVKQVLSFARGVEGQRITVDPLHLMRELLSVIRGILPKSIDVAFTPGPDLRAVTGDPTQIHQVFMNLCVNARDAMPDGGHLVVSMDNVVVADTGPLLNADARPGMYVRVRVADDGAGIPAHLRDRIFEPFFTTKGIGEGTGLGLSTSLAIIKSHGGFMQLDSHVGAGTTFEVYLPANTAAAAPDLTAGVPARLESGDGKLVLVVDDEDGILRVAQRLLERRGYRVLLAANGEVALRLYAQHQNEIAVVLTDMAMPIMDGPALILALKSINPAVRIVGSSGYTSIAAIAQTAKDGAQSFIPKPYTGEALLRVLQAAITSAEPQGEPLPR